MTRLLDLPQKVKHFEAERAATLEQERIKRVEAEQAAEAEREKVKHFEAERAATLEAVRQNEEMEKKFSHLAPINCRMTATVVEFSVSGDLSKQAGPIIADLMMSAFANIGCFVLRDRLPLSAVARFAKPQKLGSTGLLDPKTAAELGRLYGVDAVVTGGVYKQGDIITITAKLIDTKSASLLGSGSIQAKNVDAIQLKINGLTKKLVAVH